MHHPPSRPRTSRPCCRLFALCLLLAACSSETAPLVDVALPDAPPDIARADQRPADTLPEAASPDGTVDQAPADAGPPDGPDAFVLPPPPTTRKQTIAGLLPAEKQDKDNSIKFGLTTAGAGEPWIDRDDLHARRRKAGASSGAPVSLLFLVHLTDVHIIDEESPLRLVQFDVLGQSAYRMNEMFNSHVLDAMLRTINRMGDAYRPFDLAVVTGDLIDNNQLNELRWFMQLMEGGTVNPDSGDDDDPLPGPHNDSADPFQAEGLRPDVPWITVIGNHDTLVQGSVSAVWPNGVPNNPLLSWFPGIAPLIVSDDGCLTGCFDFSASPAEQVVMLQSDPRSAIALGTSAQSAVIPTVSPVPSSDIGPGEVAADPQRRLLTQAQWMAEFLKSPSKPPGHGMSHANQVQGHGCYSYDPLPGLPLRIIALDMNSRSLPDGSALATLRREVYDNFLVPELQRAQTDQVLVVLISHHPSWGFPPKGLFTPHPLDGSKRDLTGAELVDTVSAYPNVVLHLVGHGHENRIEPHLPAAGSAQRGYWEVETCATNFWPQQARVIEIVDNRDGTGTIYSTMLNFDLPSVELPGWPHQSLAAQGRHYGLVDVQMGYGHNGSGAVTDRNVLLHFAMPPAVHAKLEALATTSGILRRKVQSTGF